VLLQARVDHQVVPLGPRGSTGSGGSESGTYFLLSGLCILSHVRPSDPACASSEAWIGSHLIVAILFPSTMSLPRSAHAHSAEADVGDGEQAAERGAQGPRPVGCHTEGSSLA
jgi:hypothetical protein